MKKALSSVSTCMFLSKRWSNAIYLYLEPLFLRNAQSTEVVSLRNVMHITAHLSEQSIDEKQKKRQ